MSVSVAVDIGADDPPARVRVSGHHGATVFIHVDEVCVSLYVQSEQWLTDTAAALIDARDALREAREAGS